MTFDISSLPTTIDLLHLILAVFSIILLVLFVKKPSAIITNIEQESAEPTEQKSTEPSAPVILKEATPDAALQLLTLLQQDARFIDFIKEDLSSYSDADIGAAARVVHEGSKKTLDTYFTLAAIRSEDEETQVSLAKGFNAAEIRLTGNVVGEAPFNGILIHKGWKVTEVKLPKIADGHDTTIIAPAEVEL